MLASLFTWAVALTAAHGQFVTPPKLTTLSGAAGTSLRYKVVPPGICEQDPSVRSYSGFFDVAENEHLFFWFFEARNGDPTTAPLTVWINGGPGSTSMYGLFDELGPCGIDADGNVYNNPYSWSNVSNMLFIDQPVTVGNSYSKPVNGYITARGYVTTVPDNTCPDYAPGTCGTYSAWDPSLTANSTASAAPNMWAALQAFMGAFPQYSRESFHFTTESYGGHYAPIFNDYFLAQNAKNIPGALKINLKSVLIGNGWYDPTIQYGAFYNFTVSPGNTYDYRPFNAKQEAKMYNAMYGAGNCYDQSVQCAASGADDICSSADNFCAYGVESLLDNIPKRDEYDIREINPDPFPYSHHTAYLNSPKVQQALGLFVNFSDYSNLVGANFGATGDDDREDGTIEAIQSLLKQGVTVVMYHGDADYNCNWLGGEVVASEINAPGFSSAGYVDMKTPDGKVNGQVKQSKNFAFVRVYWSGHMVPFYQPALALELFKRGISGTDIATGKINLAKNPNYKTFGPKKSTFREGNSTVQFQVTPANATYNTTTHEPNPPNGRRRRSLPLTAMAGHRRGASSLIELADGQAYGSMALAPRVPVRKMGPGMARTGRARALRSL